VKLIGEKEWRVEESGNGKERKGKERRDEERKKMVSTPRR
jgi:hypothetical protein